MFQVWVKVDASDAWELWADALTRQQVQVVFDELARIDVYDYAGWDTRLGEFK